MRLALYQPDIPQNTGALFRLAACLGIAVDLIEPCGFVLDDRRLRRAGMDYIDQLDLTRHSSWEAFLRARSGGGAGVGEAGGSGGPARRLILLTTAGAAPHLSLDYAADDVLLLGRESAGVPAAVHDRADLRVRIPQTAGTRSLNVVTAAAIVLAEALRQTGGFPPA